MCCKTGIYETMKKARETIRFMKAKGYDKLYPYLCPDCHHYHLSSEQFTKENPQKHKSKYKQWKQRK